MNKILEIHVRKVHNEYIVTFITLVVHSLVTGYYMQCLAFSVLFLVQSKCISAESRLER